MRSRYFMSLAFGVVLVGASPVLAQTAQPKLEVLSRQGAYYWVVATEADGSRRGGWVSAQIIDGIKIDTFRPVPADPPQVVRQVILPAVISPNDFDAIVLALQGMRDKISSAASTLEGLPDGAALRNRLEQIDQATSLVKQLASDQSFGSSGPTPSVVPSPNVPPLQRPIVSTGPPPQTREGFWFNAGLGIGSLGCESCDGRENGLSGGLSFGGTLGDKFLLGVGSTGWAKTVDGNTLSVGTLDARLRFYPARKSGFFLTAGLGIGSVSIDNYSETGAGAIFGVGWDIRVGKNFSLTPFYNGFAMNSETIDANVSQLGLSFTIH